MRALALLRHVAHEMHNPTSSQYWCGDELDAHADLHIASDFVLDKIENSGTFGASKCGRGQEYSTRAWNLEYLVPWAVAFYTMSSLPMVAAIGVIDELMRRDGWIKPVIVAVISQVLVVLWRRRIRQPPGGILGTWFYGQPNDNGWAKVISSVLATGVILFSIKEYFNTHN